MNFIIYDSGGRILRTGSCPPRDFILQAQTGENVLEGEADDLAQYVSGGQVTDKAAMGALIDKIAVTADGADFCTISNLPDPCEVFINGARNAITGGSAEITVDTPGIYAVRVEAFPYLPYEVEVTAS
jgi:hypothetical protein